MACLCDLPQVTSTAAMQRLPAAPKGGVAVWCQVWAATGNKGTVWVGGSTVAQGRGCPVPSGGSQVLPALLENFVDLKSAYFFFEKSGDVMYILYIGSGG